MDFSASFAVSFFLLSSAQDGAEEKQRRAMQQLTANLKDMLRNKEEKSSKINVNRLKNKHRKNACS
jgi:hypothetical protein